VDNRLQRPVEDVHPALHPTDLRVRGVHELPRLDRYHEAAVELRRRGKKVFVDESHHGVVLQEIVGEGRAGEDETTACFHPHDGGVDGGLGVGDDVPLVQEGQVGARVEQSVP